MTEEYMEEEYMEEEFRELLNNLPDNTIQTLLREYISKNNLHSSYIEFIIKLNKDYIDKTNSFIQYFKRSVNALCIDEMFNKNVLKNVGIDKDNWFWYARLLKCTEDETYPTSNYWQPIYLLKRLKGITDNLAETDLRDNELVDLYNTLLKLYKKYEVM